MSLCPALPPEKVSIVPEGPRRGCSCARPFYRQPQGSGEVLSFADSSRFGRSASPARQRWVGFLAWPSAGGAAERGFCPPGDSAPGPLLL